MGKILVGEILILDGGVWGEVFHVMILTDERCGCKEEDFGG